MGRRSQSDISNTAIRIFLQAVGEMHDQRRGHEPFKKTLARRKALLAEFERCCCYCGNSIDEKSMTDDHVVPINKQFLGLHCWGNIVPACMECNSEKNTSTWEEFLKSKVKDPALYRKRHALVTNYARKYGYNAQRLNLKSVAGNLYEDVGEVASTLIKLRLDQAKELIDGDLSKKE
jgi:5-methylcytosine-specific restriction endonuclease McrA